MARKLQTNPLDGRTVREILKAKQGGEPHWLRLQRKPALYLGYRKLSPAGSWIVRWRLGGKYKERVIGTADDAREADGLAVLSFDMAATKARAALELAINPALQAAEETRTEAKSPMTVREVLETYVANLRAVKGEYEANRAEGRLLKHVTPYIGDRRINDLLAEEVIGVRNRMIRHDASDPSVERSSKSGANRVMASLKAALNAAFNEKKNGIESDGAWRQCKQFPRKEALSPRELDLTPDQQMRLINSCRPDLRQLVLAGILTGARPGRELCLMRCRHFTAALFQVKVPDGKTGSRDVTLTAEGVRFFEQLTAGRHPDDFIFKNRHGRPWAIDGHVRMFKEAVARAGLPAETVAYNLRHAHIAHCIVAGMPADLVARNCGTSLEQIARHYSKWSAQARQQALEAAAPRLGLVGGNIVALRA